MDTNELKKMLKNSTAVLILDNGEPSFVIVSYDSYKNLLSGDEREKEVKINNLNSAAPHLKNGRLAETLLKQIPSMKGADNSSVNNSQSFQHHISQKESELLEKINKEILSLKNEIDKEERGAEVAGVD